MHSPCCSSHMDTISLEEDVVQALRGKRLHTLHLLGLRNLSPKGIVEIISNVPEGCLKKLSLNHNNVSLRTVRDSVRAIH